MITTTFRHAAGLTTILLTTAALAMPASGQQRAGHQRRHPCPTLIVTQRPWQNVKDGKRTEWGDHWLLQWQGNDGSCAVAAAVVRSEIIHPDHERLNCEWDEFQSRGVFTTPFHQITCAPRRIVGNKRAILVYAFADPDPTFIHPGAAPKGNR
jgi:hypothetical protein